MSFLLNYLWLSICVVSGTQNISSDPATLGAKANQLVAFKLSYTTQNPQNNTLTGLGIRLHWNSQQLSFEHIQDLLSQSFLGEGTIEADELDLDLDPNTDVFMRFAWFDIFSNWPQSDTLLFEIVFKTSLNFSGTTLRFSSIAQAPGYHLVAPAIFIDGNCSEPTLLSQTNHQNQCEGRTVSFSVNAGGSNLRYQWQKDGIDIVNTNTSTLRLSHLRLEDAGYYRCLISNDCGSITSSSKALTVNPLPQLLNQITDQNICVSDDLELWVEANNAYSYQWFHNNILLPNQIEARLKLQGITQAEQGSYLCLIENDCGQISSRNIEVSVHNPITITEHPKDVPFNDGATALFSIVASGSGPLSYQWKKNGEPLPNANQASLEISGMKQADLGLYTCVVKNSCSEEETSGAALVFNDFTFTPITKMGNGNYTDLVVTDEAAYCVADFELDIIDIRDPTKPVKAGELRFQNEIERVWLYNERLYIGSYDGFYIVDISRPFEPNILSEIQDITTIGMAISGNYAYLAGNRQGVHIVDISNATNPIVINTFQMTDIAHVSDVTIKGDFLYGVGDAKVFVVDITRKISPELRWHKETFYASSIALSNNNIYLLSTYRWFSVMNIDNPIEPAEIYMNYTMFYYDVAFKESKAYFARERYGLSVMDISNIENPSYMEFINTPGDARALYVVNNYLYLADDAGGLRIYDISGEHSVEVGVYDNSLAFQQLSKHGEYWYLTTQTGLEVYDLNNPNKGRLLSKIDLKTSISTVRFLNNYVILLGWHTGLHIVSIEDPMDLKEVSNYTLREAVYGLEIDNNVAFILSKIGIVSVDLSNLENPRQLGIYNLNTSHSGFGYRDGFAFIASLDGVFIIDVRDPTNMFLASELSQRADCMYLQGNYLYVGSGQIKIYNILNPLTPALVSSSVSSFINEIYVTGDYAFASNIQGKLQSFDISNKNNPILIGEYSIPYQKAYYWTVRSIFADESYIYLSNWGRLVILGNNLCRQPVVFDLQPQSVATCVGAPVSFQVNIQGTAPHTFQWRKDGVPIDGATQDTYTIPAFALSHLGNYDCVVTNPCGTLTSETASLTQGQALSLASQPQDQWACPNGNALFTTTYHGSGPVAFQWRFNGVPIAGATEQNLLLNDVNNEHLGSYDCVLSNACGQITTASARLKLATPVAIDSQPEAQLVPPGESVFLNVTATGSALTYQWYHDEETITAATQAHLTLTNFSSMDDGVYHCVVSNLCGSKRTQPVLIKTANCVSLLNHPKDKEVCFGETATFQVSSTGSSPVSIRWYKDGRILSNNQPQLVIENVRDSDQGLYSCEISNICGSVRSETARLRLTPALSINSQPQNVKTCPGSSASFSVDVTGQGPFHYQWQKDGQNISGANEATLILYQLTSENEGLYRCVVTGPCDRVTSNPASLNFSVPAQFILKPQSKQVCPGEDVTFSVSTMGESPLTLQWRKDGAPIPGETTAELTITNVSESDDAWYDCVITNVCGSVLSRVAELEVRAPLNIRRQPISQRVCPATNTTLEVFVQGSGPISFQWQYNGEDLPGENSAILELGNISSSDIGRYQCMVQGPCGQLISSPVDISLEEEIRILQQPQNQVEYLGNTLTVSFPTSGENLNYQWYKNGVALNAAIEASLKLEALSPQDVGTYHCEISNICTQLSTNTFEIRVLENAPPTWAGAFTLTSVNQNNVRIVPQIIDETEKDQHRLQITTLPNHGQLELKTNFGPFLYTPNQGFKGVDHFQFNVTDEASGSVTGNGKIIVIEQQYFEDISTWPRSNVLDLLKWIPNQ